jgi:hypothetical protein
LFHYVSFLIFFFLLYLFFAFQLATYAHCLLNSSLIILSQFIRRCVRRYIISTVNTAL